MRTKYVFFWDPHIIFELNLAGSTGCQWYNKHDSQCQISTLSRILPHKSSDKASGPSISSRMLLKIVRRLNSWLNTARKRFSIAEMVLQPSLTGMKNGRIHTWGWVTPAYPFDSPWGQPYSVLTCHKIQARTMFRRPSPFSYERYPPFLPRGHRNQCGLCGLLLQLTAQECEHHHRWQQKVCDKTQIIG